MFKSDGDPFGDSDGEASLSSRLLSSTVARAEIAQLRSFPDYFLSMHTILKRLSITIHLLIIQLRLDIRDGEFQEDWLGSMSRIP